MLTVSRNNPAFEWQETNLTTNIIPSNASSLHTYIDIRLSRKSWTTKPSLSPPMLSLHKQSLHCLALVAALCLTFALGRPVAQRGKDSHAGNIHSTKEFVGIFGQVVIAVRMIRVRPIKQAFVDSINVASKEGIGEDVAHHLRHVRTNGWHVTKIDALVLTIGLIGASKESSRGLEPTPNERKYNKAKHANRCPSIQSRHLFLFLGHPLPSLWLPLWQCRKRSSWRSNQILEAVFKGCIAVKIHRHIVRRFRSDCFNRP